MTTYEENWNHYMDSIFYTRLSDCFLKYQKYCTNILNYASVLFLMRRLNIEITSH